MSEGFVLDVNQHGARSVATWVQGAPEKSRWLGVKVGNRPKLEIQTWRCCRCGFLESYARD
jgi:hypothetical protein